MSAIYKRGRWYHDYPESEIARAAKEWVRKWEIQQRWRKHAHILGPVPARYVNIGENPSPMAVVDKLFKALYFDAIVDQLTQPSALFGMVKPHS